MVHDWVNLPGEGDILHWWCKICGSVRVEYCGEEEPYEYFVLGSELKKQNGYYVGDPNDPGCTKKPNNDG